MITNGEFDPARGQLGCSSAFLWRLGNANKAVFCLNVRSITSRRGGLGYFDEKLFPLILSEYKTVTKRFRQMLPEVLILIIHRLFGSFDAFYEAYKWQAAICNDRGWIKLDKIKFPGRDFHRQACIDFLALNPDASRSDFWRSENASCHWLIRNDDKWFSHYLPAEKKKYAFQQKRLFKKTS